MNFYPWQTQPLNTLLSQMGTGKLPHAILLTGSEGIGKLNFALTFVQRMFCQQAIGTEPCGECDPCHKFIVHTHPDLKLIEPPEGKNTIVVDQIRELIEYVSLTPHSALKKVAVISQAELLNTNAANSLLKTLEEPPASSMLILVTHRPDRLLPTIRSRCQSLLFATPDHQQASDWLRNKLNQNANDIDALLALSGGAPLKALMYAEDNVLEKRNKFFVEITQLSSRKKNPMEVAKGWHKNDLDLTVNCLSSWVTDMIRLKALDTSGNKIVDQVSLNLSNPDLQKQLLALTQKAGLKAMLNYYQKLTKIPQLQKSNINPQMILEDLLIEWETICL